MLLDTFLFVIHNENIPLNGAAISVVFLLHLLKYSAELFETGSCYLVLDGLALDV